MSQSDLGRTDWEEKLKKEYKRLGLSEGYKLLFCPWKTYQKADVAFISLNPGRLPEGAEPCVFSDERGNSYDVERHIARSPISSQFLQMCDLLGVDAASVLCGVAMPFRSDSWSALSGDQSRIGLRYGQAFWDWCLPRSPVKLVIAVSADAMTVSANALDALLVEEFEAGWGNTKIRVYRGSGDRKLVHLPHLSRTKLFGRSASENQLKYAFGV